MGNPTSRTEKDMIELLRGHYLPPKRPAGGIFAARIGSPDGTRQADVIWMPTTRAGGYGLHGHEIKVTRSDVLVELSDATKSDPWAQYCRYWWLVVADPSLIDGLSIPPSWGIMAPPSGRRRRSMTIVRPAPELHPKEPGRGIARVAAWLLYRDMERIDRLESDNQYAHRQIERLRRDLATASVNGGARSPKAEAIARIVHEVETRLDGADVFARLDEDAVIDAAVDVSQARAVLKQTRLEIRHLVNRIDQIVEPFGYTRKKINEVLSEEAADATP